jgi:hypothetical protein
MVVADAPQVANAFLNRIIELGYHFRLFNGLDELVSCLLIPCAAFFEL